MLLINIFTVLGKRPGHYIGHDRIGIRTEIIKHRRHSHFRFDPGGILQTLHTDFDQAAQFSDNTDSRSIFSARRCGNQFFTFFEAHLGLCGKMKAAAGFISLDPEQCRVISGNSADQSDQLFGEQSQAARIPWRELLVLGEMVRLGEYKSDAALVVIDINMICFHTDPFKIWCTQVFISSQELITAIIP